jgi:polysaccharide biosynthesis/export protein
MRGRFHSLLYVALACACGALATASELPLAAAEAATNLQYQLQPGDIVTISVWKEHDLEAEVMIRPDGGLSFALAGEVDAAGHSVGEVRDIIAERLKRFVPDPVVTVAVKAIGGNHVYVIGKVLRPGEYPFSRPLDVMQALSLAGGATPYAQVNEIVILRRDNQKKGQHVLRFRYGDIARGKGLEQNVVLDSGDTVVVP